MAVVVALLAFAGSAHAERSAHTVVHGSHPGASAQVPWYGWQILLADGASLATGIAAMSNRSPALEYPAFIAYGVTAPIIHAAHGHGYLALGSLALHVAAFPLALGAFTLGGCHDYHDQQMREQTTCSDGVTAALGTLIGITLIDAFAFSFDPATKPGQKSPSPSSPPSVELGVGVAPTRRLDGITLRIGGRFGL